jgi:hypothetical protein
MTRDVDRPRDDAEWNYSARRETPTARLGRNWDDLLQEAARRADRRAGCSSVLSCCIGCCSASTRAARWSRLGQRFALAGFTTLGLAVVGVCRLIFDVVLGLAAGVTVEVGAFLVAVLWGVWPVVLRAGSAAALRPMSTRPMGTVDNRRAHLMSLARIARANTGSFPRRSDA